VGLGIATFTAHMFIFYFAVASAITPPVAIAAFAAASITKADPMRTGVAAVRAGVVIFVVPFIFAFYPELLLIEAAQLNPVGGGDRYLAGLDGEVHPMHLAWIAVRIALGLYLLASVLARFEARPMGQIEMGIRLVLAVLVLMKSLTIAGPAIVVALGVIAWHWRGKNSAGMATA
jgi:TRAP-type uncharacterized transport system fused permease subunit